MNFKSEWAKGPFTAERLLDLSQKIKVQTPGSLIDFLSDAIWQVDCREDPTTYGLIFDELIYQVAGWRDRSEAAKKISQLCERDFVKNGETAWGLLGFGAAEFAKGRTDVADFLFATSATMPLSKRFHNSNGVYNRRSPDYVQKMLDFCSGERRDWVPKVETELRHRPKSTDIVHVVAADGIYIRRYLKPLISNSLQRGGDPLTHVHAIDPDQEDLVLLQKISRDERLRLNFSYEKPDFLGTFGPGQRKGYFITPRYLHAPIFLDIYDRPLLISDIDAVVTQSWNDVRESLNSVDVGLRSGGSMPFPWRRTPAGGTVFSNTAGGRAFANVVSNYIAFVFDRHGMKRNWLIDQNALFAALEWQERTAPNTQVQMLAGKAGSMIQLAQTLEGGKDAFIGASWFDV